jgi:preprotein translocase subunit SecE
MTTQVQKKRNPISRFVSYIKESFYELRKVTWPTRKELFNYTLVTLVCVVLVAVYFAGLDFGLTSLLDAFGF